MLQRLTKTQRYVFNLFLDNDMNQNKISKKMGISRQAVAAHVKLLIKKGYIKDNSTTNEGRLQFREDYNRPERIKESYANKVFVC